MIEIAAHQFHHEIRPARIGRAGVEHLGDVGMIHHRQRLALRLEARDHRRVSIPSLMILSATRRLDGTLLLRDVHRAEAAFADLLEQSKPPDHRLLGFGK